MTVFAVTVARRIGLLIALLAVVFVVVDLLPGNAARAVLGRDASAERVAAKEHELGLDRPLPARFWEWFSGAITGDFGTTARGQPVNELLADKFPQTLLLASLALLVTVTVALLLGLWWAARPAGRSARVLQPGSAFVIAVPEFVIATLLVLVFSLWLGWLPAVTFTDRSGYPAGVEMLILPVLALAIPQVGWNLRVVRGAVTDAAAAPHVESAVLNGLPERTVLLRHILPFAWPTIAMSFATSVGTLFGGALVVETIFNYPGMGAVVAGSVSDRDTALVAAVVAVTGTTIMGVLLVADAVRAWSNRGRP
ncbi:ABC transporter permease [Nocardia flavorosea]|uniref:ABC transporter permease n=1 Tax=Nocardia flavorosea TaxID=53429 RepID=A0A846YSJ3_9NOCA|nr:ABC transporter permease [Nocardia flavorosea]NKY60651.1 ABC transporter permease [Nocardia flavorosea]